MLLFRRLSATTALTGALLVAGFTAPANAQPADVLSFSLPAIGGIEIGPAGVPGGSFRPVTVTVEPAMTAQATLVPHAVAFTVQNPAPYYYQYEYRFLSISWRNLQTGQTGIVDLRHWQKLPDGDMDLYPETLPTSAVATTGAGPVVATVSVMREQWQASTSVISVLPGLNAIMVP